MQRPEMRETARPRVCQYHMVKTEHILDIEENEAERASEAYHSTEKHSDSKEWHSGNAHLCK